MIGKARDIERELMKGSPRARVLDFLERERCVGCVAKLDS